jgi:hypothetical protein
MASPTDVIESYKTFLEVKYPANYERYCDRLKSDPESAKAEAVTFSFLRSNFGDVKVAEDISTGGADFFCKSNEFEFIAEVTCLEAESVATQSGLKNEVPQDGSAGWFSMITHKLRTKASTKTRQLSGHDFPRILVITCEHFNSDVLLGPMGAESLLTSDTKIAVPIDKPIDKAGLITELKDSVFFKSRNGELESCRRSISAILLFSILADKSLIVGILHPDPNYEFPIRILPSVPFLKMKKWPPENNLIETEWIINEPKAKEFYHQKVEFKDEELRRL